MSPLGVGANRSLSVVVCEDEFRRTIAKFDDTWNATGLQAQSGPPDEAGSDDDSCGEACRFASLRVGRINAR